MGHSSSKQASSDTTDSASSEAKLSESAASSTNSTASTGIAAIQASSSSSDSTTLDSIKTADEGEGTVPGDSTQNVTTDATSITTDTTTTTTEVTTDPGTTTTSTTTAKVDTTAEPSKPTTKATAPTSTHHRTEGINADVKNSGETTSHSSAPTGTANAKNVGAEPDAATTSPFTLSSPVLSTSVDSEGQTYIVTPSSITLLSTSTGSDGTSVYTEVAANPTGASGGISDSNNDTKSTSFMENTSAKAGVFSALGIAFVAIVFAGFLLWRRRRRRQASLKWYDHKTPPEDPFADARDSVSPNMAFVRRSIDPDRSSGWSVPGTISQRNTISDAPLVSADPFNPDAGNSHNVNLQSGRSTPSAYPPSVYDSSEHHSSEGHDAPLSQNLELPLPLVPLPAATAPPPRPARSILRETLSKPLAYLDPSRSSSPSGTSDPSSPVTPTISPFADPKTAPIIVRGPGEMYDIEENEISSIEELSRRINRRPTLLGARVRPSRSPPPGLRGFSSSNNSSDEYSS